MARQVAAAIFGELPPPRRREIISAVAHYVAGVLDRDAMTEIVDSLWQSVQIKPGDRVKTLRGSLHGVVVRLKDDGRVVWRATETGTEFIALPETLQPDE